MQLAKISRYSSSREAQPRKLSPITGISGPRSCAMMLFITKYEITLLSRTVLMRSQNQEDVTGFGEHRIVIEILRDALFEDSKSYGVKHSRYFNPISVNLLALVFTMVGPLAVAATRLHVASDTDDVLNFS
jgi:hypothetical protein